MKNFKGMSDEQLAMLYTKGSNSAFDELLARCQQKLYSYILFVVRDTDMADDVFQETFLKVITRLQEGRYTDSGKFMFWLTRIAHNIIMDSYRHQRTEGLVDINETNDLSKLRSEELMDTNRENEYVNHQIMTDVRTLMDTLPASQREVVYMRFYQELSFKEIADITGVSINTSLGRMRYALINMRRMARQHNIHLNLEM